VFLLVVVFLISLLAIQVSFTAESSGGDDFILTLKDPSGGFCSGVFVECADPDYPFDVWVDTASYQSYYAWRSEDTAMYGSFESRSGGGINFFILDQDSYDLWVGGYSSTGYEINLNVGSLDWEFIVPYGDTWYKVYDNRDNYATQVHVVGTHRIDETAPTIATSLDDGSTYAGTEEIAVTSTDEGFGVKGITLFIDDVLTDSVYTSPLTYDWDTSRFSNGEHSVRVLVEDWAGHTDSLEIDVNVFNFPYVLIPIIAAGIGIPIVVGLVVVHLRKKEQPSAPIETGPYYSSQEPVQQPAQPIIVAFCPSCGSPREPPTAKYCQNCGASFPE